MIWSIFALAFALAGGIIAGIQHAWAAVLIAVAVVLLIIPRFI